MSHSNEPASVIVKIFHFLAFSNDFSFIMINVIMINVIMINVIKGLVDYMLYHSASNLILTLQEVQ